MGSGPEHGPDPRGDGEEHGTPGSPERSTPDDGVGADEEQWDDLVLDEHFIRDAEVNEPAARTRMLQDRWRDAPPEPQPWRADTPPAGWLFGKNRRKGRRRKRRKDDD